MMEASGKKKTETDRFTDTVFSWSLEDILDENLYKNQVEEIPKSFQSVHHYFGSYLFPLLEDTRAQVHSSMETIYRAPYAEVVAFEEAKPYGKLFTEHHMLKGLEFQDVLLYNFFGSSPMKTKWRVIYDYMKDQDLLDSTLPQRFPRFSEAKHNILCSELKQLYVAVTRTRQRLWVCENAEEFSKPMFDYWKKKCLVQVRQLDDSLAQAMQVASNPEEWKSRGIKLYHEHSYDMATMCFEGAGDTYWERRSKAAGLKAIADRMWTSNPVEANTILKEAAEIFDAVGMADSAARCFSDLGEYERAARIYLGKCGDLERAGECFSLAGCYQDAADVYAKGNFFFECLTVCAKGKLFEMGLKYIEYWKEHPVEDTAVATRGEGTDKIEQEFLESCALHYCELKDNRSMMKFVRAFHSIISMRSFSKKYASLDELRLLEEGFGNYLEAVEVAKLKGDILLEADFLEKAGKFREASLRILFYVGDTVKMQVRNILHRTSQILCPRLRTLLLDPNMAAVRKLETRGRTMA